jgi:hypothetical protein
MTEILPHGMLHRPLAMTGPNRTWRAGILDTQLTVDRYRVLSPLDAPFTVRLTTGNEAAALGTEMIAQNISTDEVLGAIADVPGATEDMRMSVGKVKVQKKAGRAVASVLLDNNPAFDEEWRQIDGVLDTLVPGRLVERPVPPRPRMQLWAAHGRERPVVIGIQSAANDSRSLTAGPSVTLAGVSMGNCDEVQDSFDAGAEQRLRFKMKATRGPFTGQDLVQWVERSPYTLDEARSMINKATTAGRFVTRRMGGGMHCRFVD